MGPEHAPATAEQSTPTVAPAPTPHPAPQSPVPLALGVDQVPATLQVGHAADRLELDADRRADQALARLRRSWSPPAEEPESHRHDPSCGHLRRASEPSPGGAIGLAGGALPADSTDAIERLRSSGRPLDQPARRRMEDGFGVSFADVRVHDGPAASQLSRSMSARAFTTGRDIFFGARQYAPETPSGERVLAHELAHTLQPDQGLHRTVEDAPTIRRDIGIEFEFSGIQSSRNQAVTGKHVDLERKKPILTGVDFTLEADDLETYSDAEFVTVAFPETAAGGNRLVNALLTISQVIAVIEGLGQNTRTSAAQLQAQVPGTAAVDNRFVSRTVAAPLVGKPQVTAGVRLDALDALFAQVGGTPGAPGPGNQAATFFGGQMAPNSGAADVAALNTGIPGITAARAAVVPAVAALAAVDAGAAVLVGQAGLRALLTQLARYLCNGATGSPGYGKLIAGEFMARTDFAAQLHSLPAPVVAYFVGNPQAFVDLTLAIANASGLFAGGPMVEGDAVFDGGIYNDAGMYGNSSKFQSTMPTLTRRAWLLGIVANQDKMTVASYPHHFWQKGKVKEEMQGLGGYGGGMDALPTPGGAAPIVEFRGLKPIFGHLLLPMALDVFRYVHALNTLGAPAVFPGETLGLNINDRMDLIQNQAGAAAVRHAVITNATADFGAW